MFIPNLTQRYRIVLTFCALLVSPYALSNPSSTANTDKLIERPSWMPDLPKINNQNYAPDSVLYNDLRKRIIDKKDKKAVAELYKLANRNHIPSIVLLGYLFDNKDMGVVAHDPKKAAQFWAISAKAGDVVSIYNLAILYFNGRGVQRDLGTAEKLLQLATKKGMKRANYFMGQINELKKNYPAAMNQYQTCMTSRALVQCKTKFSILKVTRTKMNPREAKNVVTLLSQASKDGDLDASYTLSRLTAEGIVTGKSHSTMVYYLEHLVKSPNSEPKHKKIAANMYAIHNPSQADIKRGKDNYRIANGSNVRSIKFTPIDLSKTVLDAGNSFE